MSAQPRSMKDQILELLKIDEGTSVDAFAEEPVPLTVFVTDEAFVHNPPLSTIQFEAVRLLEQIYLPETYPALVENFGVEWEPVRFVNFAYLQWGKGSGKDHVCRIANARVAYLLQCLKSPQDYFGMPAQDWIHTLNVAASATQATRAYFEPLRGLIKDAKCFKDRYRQVQGTEPGRASIQLDKNIEMVSGHSRASTLEGLNILLGIADEISEFKTDEEAEASAAKLGGRSPTGTYQAIMKMIRTSARTRFPRNFKLAAISYPRFKGDAIQQLCARGRMDNDKYGVDEPLIEGSGTSRIYVSGPFSTWDVNPRVTGKEDMREDYDEDPAMSEAMYECKPGFGLNRMFRNDAAIDVTFGEKKPEPLVIDYHWGKEVGPDGQPLSENGWQAIYYFQDLHPMAGALYAIHCDLALTGDRAGIAMAHVEQWEEADWETSSMGTVHQTRPIVKLDFINAFEADIAAQPMAREIQIRWARRLAFELRKRGFLIGIFSFDNFQSADSIQILESQGIPSERLSMDKDATQWNTLRDVMYDGRLKGYHRPVVIEELRGLQRLANGKVDHPPGGSKDEADSVAGAVTGALGLGGSEAGSEEVSTEQEVDYSMPRTKNSPLAMGGSMEWGAPGGDWRL